MEMAKELTKELEENESIDWQYKESGRARMRNIVRRLLKKIQLSSRRNERSSGNSIETM